jgi:selenoprotein W-related protein
MTEAHKIKITYCAECGYEPQTLDLTKSLMLEFGAKLSSIELIPWEGGTFDVSVDGELIHSMTRDGGFGDSRAIKDAVRARLTG